MIIKFDEYILDIDVKANFLDKDKLFQCNCFACDTFKEYARTLPGEVKEQISSLGVDIYRPAEVFDLENGEYGGWWNLYGRIINNSQKPYVLCEGVELTFSNDCTYVPAWINKPCIQARFVMKSPNLIPLEKSYKSKNIAQKNTFIYNISDSCFKILDNLIGSELCAIYSDSPINNSYKYHEVNIVTKQWHTEFYQKVSFEVSRDTDTCFDGIDRMMLSVKTADGEHKKNYNLINGGDIIKCVKIFESTIEGRNDRVIYDSHILIEMKSGKIIILRVEPDGEAVLTIFTDVDILQMEKYLRVSDVWFADASLIYDENNEIIGLEHFYQTSTRLRRVFK